MTGTHTRDSLTEISGRDNVFGTSTCPTCGSTIINGDKTCATCGEGDADKGPKELGGWLVLVGVYLCNAAIIDIWYIFGVLLPDSRAGGRDILDDGYYFHRMHPGIIPFEIIASAALFVASICLIVLFFEKKEIFPRATTFWLVLQVLPWLIVSLVSEWTYLPTPGYGTLVAAAVLIPYLLKSRRVESTFVN